MNRSAMIYCHEECLVGYLRKTAILQTLKYLYEAKQNVSDNNNTEEEKLEKYEFLNQLIFSLKDDYLFLIMEEARMRASSSQE